MADAKSVCCEGFLHTGCTLETLQCHPKPLMTLPSCLGPVNRHRVAFRYAQPALHTILGISAFYQLLSFCTL